MDSPEPRAIATWQAPLEGGQASDELLFSFDRGRERRVLVLPALFDEANKLRRLTVEMMRAADANGVDTFLPDFPGMNESLANLEDQSLAAWHACVDAAINAFSISHILAIRGGALLAPRELPGWQYAPQSGAKLLRGLLRARTIAAKEMGREENAEQLLQAGRESGLMLAGWQIGAPMLRELESAEGPQTDLQQVISQKDIGGAGLWLRAEPGEDASTSLALATIISSTDVAGGAEQTQ